MMILLTSPRIHFAGTMSCNPGLANNNARLFDAKEVEVILSDGVTNETLPDFLIENLENAGIWNLYGSHDAKWETHPPSPNAGNNTRVTGGRVPLLVEQPLQVVAEQRDWNLHQGESATIPVRVFERSRVPTQPMKVVAGRYEGLACTTDAPVVLEVNPQGQATLLLHPGTPVAADYGFQAIHADSAPPELPANLDITAGQFVSTRTLPTDTELEQSTTDAQLTWEFINNTILRHWDLLNPVMAIRGLPLSDQAAMTAADALAREVTVLELHKSGRDMPITRDLSKGKRRLLKRSADL